MSAAFVLMRVRQEGSRLETACLHNSTQFDETLFHMLQTEPRAEGSLEQRGRQRTPNVCEEVALEHCVNPPERK